MTLLPALHTCHPRNHLSADVHYSMEESPSPCSVYTTFQPKAACCMEMADVSILDNRYSDCVITHYETVIKKEPWELLFSLP